MHDFIEMNPNLKFELNEIIQSKIVPDTNEIFERKNVLKKDNSKEVESVILYLDKELSEKDISQFEQTTLFENPDFVNGFKKAYLSPDNSIQFSKKELLYKKTKPVIQFKPLLKYAASLLLLLGLALSVFQFFNKKEIELDPSLATNLVSSNNIESSIIQNEKIAAAPKNEVTKKELLQRTLYPTKKVYEKKIQPKELYKQEEASHAIALNDIPKIATLQDYDLKSIHTQESLQGIHPKNFAQNTIVTEDAYQEKSKVKKAFTHAINQLKSNVLNTLSGGDDEINVAIFAIQTK
ncbi:MAG: hypothetical protein E6Q89_03625 [Bacteroidia bacterium]|nr:MAG: hypothetical protein E6Q89_03625 [Bacteroidia bacterium]